jgi:hypothetical protein
MSNTYPLFGSQILYRGPAELPTKTNWSGCLDPGGEVAPVPGGKDSIPVSKLEAW